MVAEMLAAFPLNVTFSKRIVFNKKDKFYDEKENTGRYTFYYI